MSIYLALTEIWQSLCQRITITRFQQKSRSNTPAQLFWINLHLTAFGDGQDSNNGWRGIDINSLISTELPHVAVPQTSNPLDQSGFAELQTLVDPLSPIDAKELYRRAIRFVGAYLQRNGHSS